MCLAVVFFVISSNLVSEVSYSNYEHQREYVSSRGLMKICDVYPKKAISSVKQLNYNEWTVNNYEIVYVPGSAIRDFIQNMLPRIRCNFTLVTGDCDESIPIDVLSVSEFQKFVQDPRLKHWFSQNLVVNHEKMTGIPIGLDYHTYFFSVPWYSSSQTALMQESLLKDILHKASSKRLLKCYANFQTNGLMNELQNDRLLAKFQIPVELVDFEEKRVSRTEVWEKQVRYEFVISPHGNGLDCHRTWEALVLGNIPIVRHSRIVHLFKDLPVLIVRHWSDVSMDLLLKTRAAFRSKKWNLDKLKLSYWNHVIRSK